MAEVADGNNKEVWTTESDNNGNETRISTASANGKNNRPDVMAERSPNLVGIQSKFRRKYFHKTIFIVLNGIIMLMVLAIILMAVYYRLYYKNICSTKECVRAATNLLQSMDARVDPCDDFYKFTCGNWAEDHPRPDNAHSNDWFAEKQNRVLRTVRTLLQSNGSASEPHAVSEARLMYKACMDTSKMDALGLQPVIDYLRLFALPTVPRIFNISVNASLVRPAEPFNWVRTVAIIRRTLGSDLLIGFDILPNPTNRTEKLLAFGAPETGSMLPFKNDVEKRLDKIRRRRLNEGDDDDESDDNDEDDRKAKINAAHNKYMTEVISALIFSADPTLNLADHLPAIMSVVAGSRRLEKALFKIAQAVENATVVDPHNPLAELLYLNISALQSASDRLIAPQSLPIWQQYLAVVFEQTSIASDSLATAPVLSSEGDVLYLEQFVQLLADTSEAELEFHMWWTVVDDLVLHTTTDISKLHTEYMQTITSMDNGGGGGVSRSFYCTAGVHELLGWAVSWSMVANDGRQFDAETGPKVAEMLHNIRESFNDMVRMTTWMDDGTKCATLEKSLAMRSQIGYPAWVANGTSLDGYYADMRAMNGTRHLDNMVKVLRWTVAKNLGAFNEYDADEWATTPTNVNAFHTFQENMITVPLAILQFPFYNLGIEALNYGSIGTILGHELTHGFDDSGRMFDKDGNMRQWWTNRTVNEYVNRTSCFTKQYSDYYVREVDDHIDGENTLSENIADNGGLREAFYAYQLYVKQHGREMRLPGLEHYSSEQLFFMAYGNLWCEIQTITSIRWSMEDSHCPGKVRLKGVLQNSPEFADTFGCSANATMNPPDRCRIW